MYDDVPIPREVETQLRRMLPGTRFSGKPTVSPILEFIVLATINGEVVNERTVGVRALGKPEDWDPSIDSGVRENKRHLKQALRAYYAEEGSDDPVVIELQRGYRPHWRYNPKNQNNRANPPASAGLEFLTILDNQFTEAGDDGLRCVVTEQPARMVRIDGRPLNGDFGNYIPLSDGISKWLKGFRSGSVQTYLPLLEPDLLERKASHFFGDWKIGRAYGCAYLAFHMGSPPFGNESNNRRLLRLCDVISYARCRHNGHMFGYLLLKHVLPLLFSVDVLAPLVAHRLTLELTPLLFGSGHLTLADHWLRFADTKIIKPFGKALSVAGQLSPFSTKRRAAELNYNINPMDTRFEALRSAAKEHVGNDATLDLALNFVTASRWMRQANKDSVPLLYDMLVPIAERNQKAIVRDIGVFKAEKREVADLINVGILAGLVTCQLQPDGWADKAGSLFHSARSLQKESGHTLPRPFWDPMLIETSKRNSKARSLLARSLSRFSPGPDLLDKNDFELILKRLMNVRLDPQAFEISLRSASRP